MSNARLVLVVLVSATVGSLLTALAMGRTVDLPPSPAPVVDFSGLIERLDRLIRVQASQVGQSMALPADSPSREPMEEPRSVEDLTREIEELTAVVRSQALGQSLPSAEVSRVSRNYAQPDWNVLGDLESQLDRDRNVANSSLLFLAPADVLQRYGRPTTIEIGQTGDPMWVYKKLEGGTWHTKVRFYFHDGYVNQVR